MKTRTVKMIVAVTLDHSLFLQGKEYFIYSRWVDSENGEYLSQVTNHNSFSMMRAFNNGLVQAWRGDTGKETMTIQQYSAVGVKMNYAIPISPEYVFYTNAD